MSATHPVVLVGVVLAAFAYAAVGHGGASAYLAIGSLASVPADELTLTALVLNVLVSGLALWRFRRAGHFVPWLYWPLVSCSAPASFIGARIKLSTATFELLLGIALGLAALRLLAARAQCDETPAAHVASPRVLHLVVLSAVGLALGVLSGCLGIGGGIFLSPLLLFLGWATFKQTAAVSAAFIVTNSSAGLISRFCAGVTLSADALPWAFGAFVGGLAGARLGAEVFDARWLRVVLAVVLIMAAAKLGLRGFPA